jgi:hypothetical protein
LDDSGKDPAKSDHEAAHAVTARLLGTAIVRVCTDPDDPHVRTRHHAGRTAAERIATLVKLATVDPTSKPISQAMTS